MPHNPLEKKAERNAEEARARLLETDAIKALLILSGDKDSDVQLAALNAIIKMFQYGTSTL